MPGGFAPSSVPSPQGASQYENMFLGTDFFYGPINQDMLPWTGDIQTIVGNQNLAFSLGRRLQTTLGSLIYHPEFGSRIPPTIGSVTTQNTVGSIEAYGVSSLLGDQRVARVLSINATVLTSYAIRVTFTVLPQGRQISSTPVGTGQQGVTIGGVQGSG
jgi:phage baseplate assembly protein W